MQEQSSNNNNGRVGWGSGHGGRYNIIHGRFHNPTGPSQCQVCNKYRYTALTCYHQFDHANQASSKTQMAEHNQK